eukprot:jgi/Bigna1/140094/aug1.54_g14802
MCWDNAEETFARLDGRDDKSVDSTWTSVDGEGDSSNIGEKEQGNKGIPQPLPQVLSCFLPKAGATMNQRLLGTQKTRKNGYDWTHFMGHLTKMIIRHLM